MRLKKAQVVLFRNVLDSGDAEIQDDITCLVGKNESGKTSFLQALHALNPAFPKPLNVMDYPAWLSKSHKLQGKKLENERPIRATFAFDDADRQAAVQRFGDLGRQFITVEVARDYGGTLHVDLPFDEPAWIRAFVQEHCQGFPALDPVPTTATQLAETLQGLSQKAPAEGEEEFRTRATQARTALQEAGGKSFDVAAALRSWVQDRLPKFLYVGRYHTLPGVIEIDRIASAKYEALSEDEQIAKALLDLTAADVKLATGADYERRVRELNDTANALTLEILDYWTQNTNLRVEIDYDQANQGNQAVVKHLHVRLYDNEHMIHLPFNERSGGFQWFFSFLCAFSRYRQSGQPVILLLDEPALGLHARAQRDFLRYIEERLTETCQVIFTTHSPFMVQPKHLERVRLVEDKGRKHGTKVTSDVLSTDADTVFPLQGALGYDIAQSLFVGPYNLIVEGTSDFTYLQVMSDHLKGLGRGGLAERCTIVPVGGVSQIATFSALLGSHVDATVLIDSAKQLNQRLDTMLKQGGLPQSRLIGVGEVVGQVEADIEDLFTVDEYLVLFNGAFGTTYKAADLKGTDPVVRRLARAQGVDRYDHGRPADYLLRHKADALAGLGSDTLARFEKLFARINGTLPA